MLISALKKPNVLSVRLFCVESFVDNLLRTLEHLPRLSTGVSLFTHLSTRYPHDMNTDAMMHYACGSSIAAMLDAATSPEFTKRVT